MSASPLAPPLAPSAASVRSELRRLGRVRDPRSFRRRVLDSSDGLFGGAMAVGLAWGGLSAVPDAASGLLASGGSTPLLLGPVALLAVVLVLKLLLAVGPVAVSSAASSWLLAAPVDRRSLLLGRFGAALAAGAVGGGLLFAALGPFAGRAAGVVAAAGVPVGLLVVGVAVVLQRDPAAVVSAQRWSRVVVAVAVALVAVVPALGRGWLPAGTWWPPAAVVAVAAGTVAVVVVAAVVATAVAWRGLGGFTRAALTGGTQLVDAARAAAVWLDPAMLADVLAARRARAVGRVRSGALRGGRAAVVLRAELVRLRRGGAAVSTWAGLAVVPYAAAQVLPGAAVGAVHLVAAFLATERLAAGLRAVARSAALRRALGGTDREQRLLHLVVPASGALVWCAVTFPALPVAAPVLVVVSAVGAVAVTYRMATRPDVDYASAGVVDTPYGLVPVNVVRQVMRGPGLLLVLVVVQVAVVTG
ncbi:DUF6297 family protein [Saccharothrix sp. Mg75]|uniref:DUF6297 family protein n=1 Tax=Saccharothrix sp. Mg75 TaxID=3445357 RepID=UPI003EEA7C72